LKDVLEPVCSILYQRDGSVDVTVNCAEIMICLDGLLAPQADNAQSWSKTWTHGCKKVSRGKVRSTTWHIY
jgi:hypothetical protein